MSDTPDEAEGEPTGGGEDNIVPSEASQQYRDAEDAEAAADDE